jgi:hypothetical protein
MTELAAALVKAVSQLTVIGKSQTATIQGKEGRQGYSYSYADLGDLVTLTRPVLAEAGLVALTPVSEHPAGLCVTVTLYHSSGEVLAFEPLPFPAGRDAQTTGSWMTYFRRYALLAALGMAAGDDDDGAKAVAAEPVRVPGFRSSVIAAIGKLDEAEKLQLRTWCLEQGIPNVPAAMDQAQCEAVTDWIMALPADG